MEFYDVPMLRKDKDSNLRTYIFKFAAILLNLPRKMWFCTEYADDARLSTSDEYS